MFNLPVSDTVALRFSGTSQHRDNRVSNTNPSGKGTQDFEGYGDNAIFGCFEDLGVCYGHARG